MMTFTSPSILLVTICVSFFGSALFAMTPEETQLFVAIKAQDLDGVELLRAVFAGKDLSKVLDTDGKSPFQIINEKLQDINDKLPEALKVMSGPCALLEQLIKDLESKKPKGWIFEKVSKVKEIEKYEAPIKKLEESQAKLEEIKRILESFTLKHMAGKPKAPSKKPKTSSTKFAIPTPGKVPVDLPVVVTSKSGGEKSKEEKKDVEEAAAAAKKIEDEKKAAMVSQAIAKKLSETISKYDDKMVQKLLAENKNIDHHEIKKCLAFVNARLAPKVSAAKKLVKAIWKASYDFIAKKLGKPSYGDQKKADEAIKKALEKYLKVPAEVKKPEKKTEIPKEKAMKELLKDKPKKEAPKTGETKGEALVETTGIAQLIEVLQALQKNIVALRDILAIL